MIRWGAGLGNEVRPGRMFLFLDRMRRSPGDCKEKFGAGGQNRTGYARLFRAALYH